VYGSVIENLAIKILWITITGKVFFNLHTHTDRQSPSAVDEIKPDSRQALHC
jgi:hypothetical protein